MRALWQPLLIRVAVVGLLLAAYLGLVVRSWDAYDQATGRGGGANIGAGLIAFGLLIVIGAAWGLYDGYRGTLESSGALWLLWLLVGLLVGTGWLLARAFTSDASLPAWKLITSEFSTIGFFTLLIAVPAAVGVAVGGALRRTRDR